MSFRYTYMYLWHKKGLTTTIASSGPPAPNLPQVGGDLAITYRSLSSGVVGIHRETLLSIMYLNTIQ